MKTINAMSILSMLMILGGCAVVPAAPGYYSGPPAYYQAAPVYYTPSIELGIYRGWGGRHGGGR